VTARIGALALRALAERWSRERVVRRRLPPEHGGHALWVSPDAALKLWRRDLRQSDPLLLGLAAELVRPGDTVWDIGANVGLFAFAAAFAAGPSGRVVAVEADDWLAGLVRRSAQTAGPAYAQVEVLAAAVADRPGILELRIATRGRAGNHLSAVAGSTQTGGYREARRVVAVTLDSLLDAFPLPRLLKLDVEGAEALCLRGADRLLGEVRPLLLCEVAAENADEVGERLRRHSYTLLDAALRPVHRVPLARPVWNTLAVPGAPTCAC
jgi:FkbM family methyltransferase